MPMTTEKPPQGPLPTPGDGPTKPGSSELGWAVAALVGFCSAVVFGTMAVVLTTYAFITGEPDWSPTRIVAGVSAVLLVAGIGVWGEGSRRTFP